MGPVGGWRGARGMADEPNQSMKMSKAITNGRKEEQKGKGRKERKRHGRSRWQRGGFFISFDLRETGKTAGWDMIQGRKGLGTGRCGISVPMMVTP